MPDRISLMLDTMITAVDEGFSYDGIVSIPEIGLEDAVSRGGLAGWFDDGVELFRTTKTAVSQAAARLFRTATPPINDNQRLVDSEIGTGDKNIVEVPGTPASQASHTGKQAKKEDEEGGGGQSGLVKKLPRKSEDSPRLDVDQKLPRKKMEQILGDTARGEDEGGLPLPHPDTEKSPRKKSDQALAGLPRLDLDPKLPRKKREQVLEGTTRVEDETGHQQPHPVTTGNLPRKRSERVLEDIAGPNVGQSLPMPTQDEDELGLTGEESQPQLVDWGTLPRKMKPPSDEQEKLPRKKDNESG